MYLYLQVPRLDDGIRGKDSLMSISRFIGCIKHFTGNLCKGNLIMSISNRRQRSDLIVYFISDSALPVVVILNSNAVFLKPCILKSRHFIPRIMSGQVLP